MKLLIGITGKAGSGKDTVADWLWERHGFLKLAFADPLKLAAEAIFGLPRAVFHDRGKKEAVHPYWGKSPRELLQLLGTEATKPVFGEDIWLKRWLISYSMFKDTDPCVVPDVRFDLEAQYLRNIGGVILHLNRDAAGLVGSTSNHASEQGVTPLPGDFGIDNNGSLKDLRGFTDLIVDRLTRRGDL